MTKRKKGLIMVCLGASMWGGSGVAGQYLLQDCGFSTVWLVVSRMLLAGCLFLLIDFALYRQNVFSIWKNKQDARDVLLFAIFGMLAVQYTYFACIQHGNAAAATILQYLMPVIIIGYTSLATHKFPPGRELLCVVMAIGGTFLLVTHGRLDTLSIPLAALLWGLGSAFAAAFYTTQPKRLIRKWRATLITGWGMLLGGLALMPVCPPWQFSGTWSSAAAITYAYIIIFGTVIAFGCYLGSIKYISPTETSLLGSIEPLSAIVFSILFLHASFAPMDYLGTALILSTVFVLAKK
ncbi:DMT family transporter [Selenomonas ruminis]|uniref:EamA family transporter n=1 Tax=Selenomonas ruminis TaxID=2593411 RepID=A0A5D6WDE7_9FIRM|nr:EamA family transporter [Selenomonas sp. mPRGC5]TYZ25009.1 EamA family transporter [Selenomonas sp. mPRGC5]